MSKSKPLGEPDFVVEPFGELNRFDLALELGAFPKIFSSNEETDLPYAAGGNSIDLKSGWVSPDGLNVIRIGSAHHVGNCMKPICYIQAVKLVVNKSLFV
jgi:hypothetical protein